EHYVRIEPSDRSALVLIDASEASMITEARELSGSKEPFLRRQVWDAMTGKCFECVFSVEAAGTRENLHLLGMAELIGEEAQSIGAESTIVKGRIHVKTRDGHYLSFSHSAGQLLVITSHGRSVSAELLMNHRWTKLDPTTVSFSKGTPPPPQVNRTV